ncbi:MAG: UpxY family transcription antiterminator [Vicinamibacterales bacterium]
MTAWHAIWTRSRHEHTVVGELARRDVEAFLPTVARWSRWKDRKKRISWPLFPGYCFARFDNAALLTICKTPGVVSVVTFDGALAVVPDEQIDSVRRLVHTDLLLDPCPLVREGSLVKVVSGPLAGMSGTLVRKGPQARLVIAVEAVGQAVSVQVDACDVRAL